MNLKTWIRKTTDEVLVYGHGRLRTTRVDDGQSVEHDLHIKDDYVDSFMLKGPHVERIRQAILESFQAVRGENGARFSGEAHTYYAEFEWTGVVEFWFK